MNADALRAITDDSGGRTEIIVSPRDLDPATAGIADELSRQYFLGYTSTAPKDGRWHTIEVQAQARQLHGAGAEGFRRRRSQTYGSPARGFGRSYVRSLVFTSVGSARAVDRSAASAAC